MKNWKLTTNGMEVLDSDLNKIQYKISDILGKNNIRKIKIKKILNNESKKES